MKANELSCKDLMIGDWVMINPISYYQVEQIRMEFGELRIYLKGTEVFATENEIMPTPITPEILEKNGFVTNDEQGNWNGYRIYSLFNTNKSCIFMLKLYEKDSIVEISLDMSPYYIVFKFVHQLQHALRLCGIEKEIVL